MARRPVRIDTKDPKGLVPLSQVKTIPYDFGWAAKNKDAFVKKFVDIAMELGL